MVRNRVLTKPISALRQLKRVVGRGHLPGLLWVLVLTVAVAILEFVAIGALLPLFGAILGAPNQHTAVDAALGRLGIHLSDPQSLVRYSLLVLSLFVVKAVVTAYSMWEGYRFSYRVQVDVGQRLLRALLSRDYEFFLGQNSAVLVKTATTEVLLLAGGVLIPLVSFVAQTLVVATVVLVVASVSPGSALLAFALVTIATGGFYAIVSRRLTRWGKLREQRLSDMHRVVHQAVSGIKAVKTHASEHAYLRAFTQIGHEYAGLNTRYQVAGATPPMLIELMLFGGVIGLIIYFATSGANLLAVLPTLGVFAVAAYRILPSARKAFADLVTIRYHWPCVDLIEQEIDMTERVSIVEPTQNQRAAHAEVPRLSASISLTRVSYRYPSGATDAIRDVTLTIPHGSHVALVGRSGAGKSTIVDIVLGLLSPSSGSVSIDGVTLNRDNVGSWLAQIGYVPQQVFLADATLAENVAFGVAPDKIDRDRVWRAVENVQLGNVVRSLPFGIDTPVGENGARLSGGERQRLGIARALYREPRLLVLDEATSALDTITEQKVNEDVLAACRDMIVVIVAHRLSTVRHCDQLVLISQGAINCIGTYDELVAHSTVFAEMHKHSLNAT